MQQASKVFEPTAVGIRLCLTAVIIPLSLAGAPALMNLCSVSFILSHIWPTAVRIRLCPTDVI